MMLISVSAQKMKDPRETVSALFVATDERDWPTVDQLFADKVLLDYSSMSGNPATTLSPEQIIAAWKSILPGFESTHHQVGNLLAMVDRDRAEVFCYGTASHYLSDAGGNVWTVVGTYDFELTANQVKDWEITAMKFNFKYQDGNTALPTKAIENTKDRKSAVRAFFKALESEDVDQIVALFAEGASHINPYASGLFPDGAMGREAIREYWTPVFPNFDGMSFPIEEIYTMEDPNMVFVKYKGKIKLKNSAGTYENDYFSTFKFDEEGLITEYVEIFNPIVAARGFGMLDKIK